MGLFPTLTATERDTIARELAARNVKQRKLRAAIKCLQTMLRRLPSNAELAEKHGISSCLLNHCTRRHYKTKHPEDRAGVVS